MLAHLKIADSCVNDNNDFDDDDDDDIDDDFDKDDDYDDEKCSAPSVILLHLRPHISPELTWTQCLETRSAQNTQNTKIQGEKYEHREGGCDKARSMCQAALQHCTLPHFPSLMSSSASSSGKSLPCPNSDQPFPLYFSGRLMFANLRGALKEDHPNPYMLTIGYG